MTFELQQFGYGPGSETGALLTVRTDGKVIAVVSAFDRFFWAGRTVYDGHSVHYRVALYDARDLTRLGVFDQAQYRINDLAFHPTEPVIAIATGEYDGGWYFRGDLIVWNWNDDFEDSVLTEDRAVSVCRFEPDGRLAVVVEPTSDESDDGGAVRLSALQSQSVADLALVEPATMGFDDASESQRVRDAEAWRRLAALGLCTRSRIWDIAVTPNGRLVAAFDDHLEIWPLGGADRPVSIATSGTPVQLLRQPTRLLVHVIATASTLFQLDGEELVEWASFGDRRTCSVDAGGFVLARNTESRRTDQVLGPDGSVQLDRDLGSYDVFNHYLRIDGDKTLFFLRGSSTVSHQNKVLYAVAGGTSIRVVAPWDTSTEQYMDGTATALDDGDLVRYYRVHHPRGFGPKRIERWNAAADRVVWRQAVSAAPHALVYWPSSGVIVAGLADGTLCILDAGSGTVRHQEFVFVDGVRTVVSAIAVTGDGLALGTVNGHILMLRDTGAAPQWARFQ